MPRRKLEKMEKKPPVEFTVERKETYLRELEATGYVSLSAAVAGITDRTVQQHVKDDPEFAEMARQAKARHTDRVIMAAMLKRGIDGFERPVIGGQFRDEVVAHEQVYSDSLLLALAKMRMPEMKDGDGASGGGGGIMFIPAAAPMTMDEWEDKYGEAAKGHTGKPKA